MTERDQEEFAFIREKIKEKPINKKRFIKHGVYTFVFGSAFGLVACLVFTLMQPILQNWMYPQQEPMITIPEDEWVEATEQMPETEIAEVPETETEETPTETVIKKELELVDYQRLQNKVYAIGKDANPTIATVTGVMSNTDWYNNAYESKGQAAGIIIGDNGKELLILTEYKVVADAEEISVTFLNEDTVKASLKKYDGNTGIAILAIALEEMEDATKEKIQYAVLGNSLGVAQGNIAIAIGSPLGTTYSIGTGNITSVGNVIHTADTTYTVFTTDIVGSSSSSGALLNLSGEVVGLVMQDYSTNGSDNTLTAISISELKKIIEMLSNGKDIPYLGVSAVTVTDKIANEYKLPKGVFIKEVMMDSPAWEAGLQSGDIIVEVGGEEILSTEVYTEKVLSLEPGMTTEVVVKRQSVEEYIEVNCSVTAGKL